MMKVRGLLIVFLITLVAWHFLIPLVNSLKLPIRETHEIISAVVLLERSPTTNIIVYLILFLLPCLALILFELSKNWLNKIVLFSSLKSQLYSFLRKSWVLPSLGILAIASWVASRTPFSDVKTATTIAGDPFHFGEKIGLTEAYLDSPRAFFDKQFLMIHGFGLNVLPDVLSSWIAGIDHDFSITLIIVHLQFLIPVIASFLILFEVSIYILEKQKWKVFAILCLVYFAFHSLVFALIDREAVFAVQFLITLRWIRIISSQSASNADRPGLLHPIYPVLIGISIPICILFVYDRAVYFLAILAVLSVYLLCVKGIRFALNSFSLILVSAVSTTIILSLFLGFKAVPESLRQVLYWSKVSGLFTSLPYPQIAVAANTLLLWLPILLQSVTLTILCLQLRTYCFSRREKFSYFLSEHSVPLFLLLAAVFFMRVALGRSDGGHLVSPGFFSIFAFLSTVGFLFRHELQKGLEASWQHLFTAVFIFASLLNMSSVFESLNLSALVKYPSNLAALAALDNSAVTQQMLPQSYVEAAEKIKPELNEQSCFYTLTSDGLWYRILSMRPCSKYWYLIYSTTADTQRDLISDLKQTKPNIILYSTNFSSSLDGVQREVSHLRVHQYIWENYRPYKLIDGHWFWKRREKELDASDFETRIANDKLIGDVGRVSIDGQNSPANANLAVAGWALPFSESEDLFERVVLMTYNRVGSPKLTLLGLAPIIGERPDVSIALNDPKAHRSGWSITFNRLNLPQQRVRIKAWVYNPIDQKFYQIPRTRTVKPVEEIS